MAEHCRSCTAEIVWAVMPSGKLHPVDAKPVPGGNIAAYRDGSGELLARVLKAGEDPEAHELLGSSHFSTCPNADAHRKRT